MFARLQGVVPGRSGLILFILLGALTALGQAPVEAPWLAVFTWALALGLLPSAPSWGIGAWRGWAFGFGHFAIALHWIVEPFLVDAPRHGWMAPFALVLLAGGLALFWALATGLAVGLGRRNPRRIVLYAVAALTVAEMGRGVIFTGFPWATIGHIWSNTAQMQIASLFGVPGLTLLTLLAAALPALCARRAVLGVALGAGLLGLVGGWGLLHVPQGPAPVTGLHIRVIQPNAPQDLKWHPDHAWGFYERQLDFTAAAAPDGGPRPDVVLWPEIAVPFPFDPGDPDHDAQIARMGEAAQGAQLILGMQAYRPDLAFANKLVHLDDRGRPRQSYDKHHLVPFGEYMPLSGLFDRLGIFGLAANLTGGFTAGPGPQVLDLVTAGKVLPLICYEVIFPGLLRAAPERADWIVQITNDAWFGDLAGPYQHLAQARLRAVEQGLPLMRAANTGISGGFDPYGRDLAFLPLGVAGFADLELPEPLLSTPYLRFGDLPVGLFVLCIMFIATVIFRPLRIDGTSGAA